MMQRIPTLILLIVVLTFVSGCQQPPVTPTLEVDPSTPTMTREPTKTPTPFPPLEPATEEALRLYPLHVGSTWEYAYLGYDQNREVVWRVVETVVDTRIVDGYYVAELEQSAELLDGEPTPDFKTAPETGKFWYLVDGQDLYRFDEQLSTRISGAWLDLVLPFPENNYAWYPNADQRADLDHRTTGFRYASAPFKKVLPMGGTYTCYNIATRYEDGNAEGTFCEGVGYVYQEFNYYNRAFGFRSELRSFTIQ